MTTTIKKMGELNRGDLGTIVSVQESEISQRLFELGFLIGAKIEILHVGPFSNGVLAIKIKNSTIALRRSEANSMNVEVI